jgi:hypothetical protein
LGETASEVACPNDGWRMENLKQAIGLSASRETLALLASGVRSLLSQGCIENTEHAKRVLASLNSAMGLFENDTEFVKLGVGYSVALDEKY